MSLNGLTVYGSTDKDGENVQSASIHFSQSLTGIRNRQRFSDFTIYCEGQQWPVHRLVIAANSPVLAKMCDGPFKEAKLGQACLDDDDQIEVGLMIDFFYSKLYKYEPSATDNTASSSIEMHARMYRLAEKYGCVDLKGYAQWAFRKSVTWQRHGSMSTWPKQMGSQLLDAAPYIFEQSSSISEGLGKEFVTAFYSAEGTDGWSVMKSVGKAKWVSFAKDYPEAAAEISYYATSVIKGALRSKAKSGT